MSSETQCVYCKTANGADAVFCKQCGRKLAAPSTAGGLRLKSEAPAAGTPCPSCGASMPADARLCTACGLDTKTGQKIVASLSPSTRGGSIGNTVAKVLQYSLVAVAVLIVGFLCFRLKDSLHISLPDADQVVYHPLPEAMQATYIPMPPLPSEPDWGSVLSNHLVSFEQQFRPPPTNVFVRVPLRSGEIQKGILVAVVKDTLLIREGQQEVGIPRATIQPHVYTQVFARDYAYPLAAAQLTADRVSWSNETESASHAQQAIFASNQVIHQSVLLQNQARYQAVVASNQSIYTREKKRTENWPGCLRRNASVPSPPSTPMPTPPGPMVPTPFYGPATNAAAAPSTEETMCIVRRPVPCIFCAGSGSLRVANEVAICPACGGKGYGDPLLARHSTYCPACGGMKVFVVKDSWPPDASRCRNCSGQGFVLNPLKREEEYRLLKSEYVQAGASEDEAGLWAKEVQKALDSYYEQLQLKGTPVALRELRQRLSTSFAHDHRQLRSWATEAEWNAWLREKIPEGR